MPKYRTLKVASGKHSFFPDREIELSVRDAKDLLADGAIELIEPKKKQAKKPVEKPEPKQPEASQPEPKQPEAK